MPSATHPASAVVVGAGFAGLSAALELVRRGAAVTVLEARRRVGGRVWSIELSNGAVAELGAEWIEPGEAAVRELAAAVGVRLLPAGIAYRRRVAPGPLGASPEEQDAALAAMAAVRDGLPDERVAAMTLGEFIDSTGLDPRQRATVRARLQGTFGADLSEVALRAADRYGGTQAPDESDLRAEGGNQRIAEAVAARLPDTRLGHMVKQVDHSELTVTVRGEANGAPFTVEADAAVVAIPAPLVGDVRFDPPLPEEMSAALRVLPMGVAAKLAVPTATPGPSPRAIQELEAPFWCWAGLGEGGTPRAALTAFAGSADAVRSLSAAGDDPGPWLRRMLDLNPGVRVTGEPATVAWERDPLAQGCYAAFDNRSFDRRALFSRPSGRLAFAGEHTAGAVGTMNGAVETGLRATGEVAAMLGLPPSA